MRGRAQDKGLCLHYTDNISAHLYNCMPTNSPRLSRYGYLLPPSSFLLSLYRLYAILSLSLEHYVLLSLCYTFPLALIRLSVCLSVSSSLWPYVYHIAVYHSVLSIHLTIYPTFMQLSGGICLCDTRAHTHTYTYTHTYTPTVLHAHLHTHLHTPTHTYTHTHTPRTCTCTFTLFLPLSLFFPCAFNSVPSLPLFLFPFILSSSSFCPTAYLIRSRRVASREPSRDMICKHAVAAMAFISRTLL